MADFISDKKIANVVPSPESQGVSLTRPVSFSVRGVETFIDPTRLQVAAGYAKVFSRGGDFFDKDLPRTRRGNFLTPAITTEPTLALLGNPPDRVAITKSSASPQNSVYYTTIDAGSKFDSVMVSAVMRPLSLATATTTNVAGTVLGLENGQRNTAAYLFFQRNAGIIKIVVSGPVTTGGVITPVAVIDYDAANTLQRYTIVWNESRHLVQLFADSSIHLGSFDFSFFPTFASTNLKHVSQGEYVAVYGQEGASGNESEWSSVCITNDVGYPLIGVIRPGDFVTTVRGAELIRLAADKDPLKDPVSPWFKDLGVRFANYDTGGVVGVEGSVFLIDKVNASLSASDTSLAVYRDEPSFMLPTSGGLFVDMTIKAISDLREQDYTGMGVVIYDGQTVFKLALLDDTRVKTIGVLTAPGLASPNLISSHLLPGTDLDWTAQVSIRFLVDTKQERLRMYLLPDVDVPILDVALVRSTLPSGDDYSYTDVFPPFIAIGHPNQTNTAGTFEVFDLRYGHLYQTWEAASMRVPNDIFVDPLWQKESVATNTAPNPTSPITDFLDLDCTNNCTVQYSREAPIGPDRGGIVEAKLQILYHDRGKRTGDYVLLDDGVKAYMLGFIETDEGKFACLVLGDSDVGFKEVAGRDGPGASVSFPLDWDELHTYRLERRPGEGVFVFTDGEADPKISFPESRVDELPDTFSELSPIIRFGHLAQFSHSISRWRFVRGMFNAGYEVSFKKNKSDVALVEELFGTQALVLIEAKEMFIPSTAGMMVFSSPAALVLFVNTSPLVNTIVEIVTTGGLYILFYT
jgi:hypothetical protein